MNSDDEDIPFNELLPTVKKSNNINITTPLDLSRLSKSCQFNLKDYHKLRLPNWPPNEVIDQSFTCISCNLQSSPRSTTPIISKIKFLDRTTGLPLTPRSAKQYVEYCCNDCVSALKSTTSSPRFMEFAPATPPSPRLNQEKAQRDRIESRRSITVPIERRGSINDGPASMTVGGPVGMTVGGLVGMTVGGLVGMTVGGSVDSSPKLIRSSSMSKSPAKIIFDEVNEVNNNEGAGGSSRSPDFIRRKSNDINSSPARPSNLSRSKTASDLDFFTKK